MESLVSPQKPNAELLVKLNPVKSKEDLAPELKKLYDAVYAKTISMVHGPITVNTFIDPNTILIILSSSMQIAEGLIGVNGKKYTGPEKKAAVLTVTKMIIHDLAANGVMPVEAANEVNKQIDLWGNVAIDLAIGAANHVYEFSKEFIKDAKTSGCNAACKENCCCCLF